MSERFYTTEQISEHIGKTPDGFLLCEGVPIARTGEMKYSPREASAMPWLNKFEPDEDGFVHVHRRPGEVFRPETLKSFEGKALTIDHPDDGNLLHPDNWADYAVGNIQHVRRGEGDQADLMLADILVTTEDAIELVLSGLREISCGYDAKAVETSRGNLDQVNIVGNHVALVNKGRAGARCAIQDSEDTSKGGNDMSFKARMRKALASVGAPAGVLAVFDAVSEEEEEKKGKTVDEDDGEGYVKKKDLNDALDCWWKKTKDAEAKSVKDAEDVEGESKKDLKKDEEGEEEDGKTKDKGKVKDSGDFQDAAARAEILLPGHSMPVFDSVPAADRNKVLDAAKREVLIAACKTKEGEKVVKLFTKGVSIADLDGATLDAAFTGASEVMGMNNNSRFARKSIKPFDFRRNGASNADVNKQHEEFWKGKK